LRAVVLTITVVAVVHAGTFTQSGAVVNGEKPPSVLFLTLTTSRLKKPNVTREVSKTNVKNKIQNQICVALATGPVAKPRIYASKTS
jgi:hypothetical protein